MPAEPRDVCAYIRENLTDMWDDANMRSVITYLRGSRRLALPQELKDLLPTHI